MASRALALCFAASVLSFTAGAGAAAAATPEGTHRPADLVVTDARIYTARAPGDSAEALAVADGKIVFVGSASERSCTRAPRNTSCRRDNG